MKPFLLTMAGYYSILVLFLVSTTQGISAQDPIFMETPKNTVVFTGERVQLDCNYNTTLDDGEILTWTEYTTGIAKNIYISGDDLPDPDKYGIDDENDNGKYHLIIKNTTLRDAGPYKCLLHNKKVHAAGGLVVLDSPPTCGLSGDLSSWSGTVIGIEDEPTELSCRVKYGGEWVPKMEWATPDQQHLKYRRQQPNRQNNLLQIGGSTAEELLSIKPQIEDEGNVYTCQMFFTKPPVNQSYYEPMNCADENMCDQTAPNTTMECSLNLTVHYGVRNITIYPVPFPNNTLIMKTGDKIRCFAKGNPEPWIQWFNQTDQGMELLANGNSLVLTENMLGTMEAVCMAENIVNRMIYMAERNVTIIVEMGKADPPTTTEADPPTTTEADVTTTANSTIASTTTPGSGCRSTFGQRIPITQLMCLILILMIFLL